jgi:hypothetical protein
VRIEQLLVLVGKSIEFLLEHQSAPVCLKDAICETGTGANTISAFARKSRGVPRSWRAGRGRVGSVTVRGLSELSRLGLTRLELSELFRATATLCIHP